LYSAKKEAKRLEKEAKLAAKTSKVTTSTPTGKKVKEQKEKKEAEPEFVNTTPPGQKKGLFLPEHISRWLLNFA
jgi:valyl-tRNA synthetase